MTILGFLRRGVLKFLVVITVGALFFSGCLRVQVVQISREGAAKAVIVVDRDASAPVRHAADELAMFLGQVTGGQFAIANDASHSGSRIFVGEGAAKAVYPEFTVDGLGADGMRIQTRGRDLILAGGETRGTLYAVYTFLEEYVGCRWWSSKASTIPQRATIEVEDIDVTYEPVVEYREPFWFDAFDADWAVRNKYNGSRSRIEDVRGGKHKYEGFVHTFHSLIPAGKYFAEHPEWFSLVDGKREQVSQLCLTNEEMRVELIKNLKERLRRNPAATIASVSQNDRHRYCQCDDCARVDAEEGSPAGSLLRFVNAVAKETEEEFPNVAISTLAYQYTRKPPKLVRPLDSVIVRLCSIECTFAKPLFDEVNKAFRDDIIGWSKICRRLYIWDYTTNFRHHFRPHPNLNVLGPNVKFFVEHGVRGIFEQGAYTTNGAEMAELRAWVLAKLLWDPTLDADELIDEFLRGYYGPAGVYVKRYLDTMHESIGRTEDFLGCLPSYSSPVPKFLSYAALSEGWGYLVRAKAAVKGDAELVNRVEMAQLPVMYCFVRQWDSLKDGSAESEIEWPMADSINEVYDKFMVIARRNGVTRVNEWDDGFELLEEKIKKQKE